MKPEKDQQDDRDRERGREIFDAARGNEHISGNPDGNFKSEDDRLAWTIFDFVRSQKE